MRTGLCTVKNNLMFNLCLKIGYRYLKNSNGFRFNMYKALPTRNFSRKRLKKLGTVRKTEKGK
jgi:hypothetical protein